MRIKPQKLDIVPGINHSLVGLLVYLVYLVFLDGLFVPYEVIVMGDKNVCCFRTTKGLVTEVLPLLHLLFHINALFIQ